MASSSDTASAPSVVFNGSPNGNGGCRDSCAEHMVIQSRVDDSAQHVLNALHTDSRLNGDGIACARHDAVKACDDNGRDILRSIFASDANCVSTTRQVGDCVRSSVDRNGDKVVASIERNSDALSAMINDTRNLVGTTTREVLLSSKDLALQVCKTENILSRQAADNAGSIKLEMLKSQNSLERQAAENASSIRLEALKNKEELMRQLCHYCSELKERLSVSTCELKQTVLASTQKTDSLIQDQIVQTLRDKLALANQTILADQMAAAAAGVTLPAVSAARRV